MDNSQRTRRVWFIPARHLRLRGIRWQLFGKTWDEWHNTTLWVTIPLIGMVTVRFGNNHGDKHVWAAVGPAGGPFTALDGVYHQDCRQCRKFMSID